MIGRSAEFHGAAPGSGIYAAEVFCGLPTGGAADAVSDAFAWLAREKVAVIHVRLGGPSNAILETVVRRVVARGRSVDELARSAVDLGTAGLDPIYGYGLVGADLAPAVRLAGVRAR